MRLVNSCYSYVIVVLAFLLGVAANADPKANWSAQMQSLSTLLPQLVSDASKEKNFTKPETLKRVKANTKKLVEISKDLSKLHASKIKGPIDKDPSIGLLSQIFHEETRLAHEALNKGHYGYARAVIRTLGSYCFSCHTRTGTGPRFAKMRFKISTDGLNPVEKADLYASTRQFDAALKQYEAVIKDKKFQQNELFAWESALRKGIAISVRVYQSPDRALAIIKGIPKTTPLFVSAAADNWRKSLLQWKKENSKRTSDRPHNLIRRARDLIRRAGRGTDLTLDDSRMIEVLRASALLHQALQSNLSKTMAAQAFYLMGLSYEAIDVLRMWSLPEVFHQSCIQKNPHSEQALRCYARFERNIYRGYTGSSGTHLPDDVKLKLERLRVQATPKK